MHTVLYLLLAERAKEEKNNGVKRKGELLWEENERELRNNMGC